MVTGNVSGTERVLPDRVAIVTGASRGIGKGLAFGLANAGAAVVCAARTETEEPGGLPGTIHATAEAIAQGGGRALAVRCDVAEAGDLAHLVEHTVATFGRVDVLVNNAMAPTRGRLEDMTDELWDMSMTANVRSLFVSCRAVMPHMRRVGGGSIINISSGAAEHASTPHLPPGFAVYAMAKAAMERFTSAVAPELAESGIAINALRPGAVKTELATRELGEDYDWTGWATPAAVVPAVVFLALRRAEEFTGRVVDSTRFEKDWP